MSECFLPGSPPKEVVDYFRKKTLQSAFDWRDIWREENIASFQVAKAMSADVLRGLYESIDRAISDGVPFQQFKKELIPRLQKLGWWGETEVIDPKTGEKRLVNITPHRLRRIYDTNISTAYAAGRWEKIQRTKAVFPYLLYQVGASREHRVDHLGWAGTVLPVDHEFWHQHYPPNGWGCKCRAKQVSRSEYKKILEQGAPTGEFTQKLGKDGKPTGHIEPVIRPVKAEDPKAEMAEWTNKRTGKTYMIPKGIDPGFGMNWGMRGGGCGGMVETNSELLLPDTDLILVLNASSSAAKSCNLLSKEKKLKESEDALSETEQKLKNKYRSLTPENSDKFLKPDATPKNPRQSEIDTWQERLNNPEARRQFRDRLDISEREAIEVIHYELRQLGVVTAAPPAARRPWDIKETPYQRRVRQESEKWQFLLDNPQALRLWREENGLSEADAIANIRRVIEHIKTRDNPTTTGITAQQEREISVERQLQDVPKKDRQIYLDYAKELEKYGITDDSSVVEVIAFTKSLKKDFPGCRNAVDVIKILTGSKDLSEFSPPTKIHIFGGDKPAIAIDSDGDSSAITAIHRSFNLNDHVANHEYFLMPEEYRGKDLGKQVIGSSVEYYRKIGIKKVNLNADLSVGGYAWAKYGFVPDQSTWNNFRFNLSIQLDTMKVMGIGDYPEHIQKILENPDPKAIWALSDTPEGKKFLLGKSWNGTLNLEDPESMARFDAYISRKKG